MFKFKSEIALITAGFITAAASIYNSERSLSSANDHHEKINSLENKIELLSQNINKLIIQNKLTSSPTELTANQDPSTSKPDILNDIDIDVTQQCLNHFDLTPTFSLSIIIFSIVVLSSLLGLVFNNYTDKYGVEWGEKLPDKIKPIFNYYLKFKQYSTYNYYVLIFTSQLFTLLLALYMNIRNIA